MVSAVGALVFMARFIEGLDRQQTMLLPEYPDDYVDENGPVRTVDAFLDMLDLATPGFNVQPLSTGRPGLSYCQNWGLGLVMRRPDLGLLA